MIWRWYFGSLLHIRGEKYNPGPNTNICSEHYVGGNSVFIFHCSSLKKKKKKKFA